jgi:hypothetical protein
MKLFVRCLALCFLASAALAANTVTHPIRVRTTISAPDDLQNELTTQLNRELRQLPGIEVVADDPDWVIRVTADELNASGQHLGTGFAITYLESFRQMSSQFVDTDACLTPSQKRSVRAMLDQGFRVRDTSIYLGAQPASHYAHDIAMYFNAQFLEPHREH